MQTFLPYPDFRESARTLDNRRLGKQRVETYQALLQLCGIQMIDFPEWEPRLGRWHHPVLKMWSGHELSLLRYQEATCDEWDARGFNDTCRAKSRFVVELVRDETWSDDDPWWLGHPYFHMTHRSNLIWKQFEHYSERFPDDTPERHWDESDYWEYDWPITDTDIMARMEANYLKAVVIKNAE